MVHTVSALFYLFMGGKSIADLTTKRRILNIPPWGILGNLCKMLLMFVRDGQMIFCKEIKNECIVRCRGGIFQTAICRFVSLHIDTGFFTAPFLNIEEHCLIFVVKNMVFLLN